MFQTILFPIDQSREAFETASKAIELAKSHQGRIIMLSVIQPERPEMHDAAVISTLLKTAQSKVEAAGIACDVLEKQGKSAFVICDVADDLNVDVIVMGTRGVNLEEENESTASRVIQLAPCPVLIVP